MITISEEIFGGWISPQPQAAPLFTAPQCFCEGNLFQNADRCAVIFRPVQASCRFFCLVQSQGNDGEWADPARWIQISPSAKQPLVLAGRQNTPGSVQLRSFVDIAEMMGAKICLHITAATLHGFDPKARGTISENDYQNLRV